MYSLDVFYQVTIDRADAAELAVAADPAQRLAGLLAAHQLARFGTDQAPIGDAGAVLAVAAPDGLRVRPDSDRIDIAVTVDPARYRALFLSTLIGVDQPGLPWAGGRSW